MIQQTSKEFQAKHSLTDEEMEKLKKVKEIFNGKIVHIGTKGDGWRPPANIKE